MFPPLLQRPDPTFFDTLLPTCQTGSLQPSVAPACQCRLYACTCRQQWHTDTHAEGIFPPAHAVWLSKKNPIIITVGIKTSGLILQRQTSSWRTLGFRQRSGRGWDPEILMCAQRSIQQRVGPNCSTVTHTHTRKQLWWFQLREEERQSFWWLN